MATHKELNHMTIGKQVVDAFADNVKGRTFLITGPSIGGIGAETAYALSLAQPRAILLAGRDISKIQPVIDRIHNTNPSLAVYFILLSLDNLDSVRAAATAVIALDISLDIIINNAAVMFCPFTLTPQGIEYQFGINHIGHFLLTNLLLSTIRPGGRIINVSSSGHYFSAIRFTDPNFANGYDPIDAYGQAKTANILHALSLAEKLREKGISAYSLHPGSIQTGLQVHTTPATLAPVIARARELWPQEFVHGSLERERKTLEQGCSTTLVAALDPALEKHNGAFLHDCQLSNHLRAEHATKLEEAEKLWKLSEDLISGTFSA